MSFAPGKAVAFVMSLQGDDKVKAGVRGVTEGMWDAERAVGLAQKAFIGLVGIAGAGAFVGMVKGSIDAAAGLHDLSIKTGLSVSALEQFRAIGVTSGTSADAVASASNRLAKNLATTSEEGKGAALALSALGINYDDFRKLSPDKQMLAVATAMGDVAEGTDKSAAAMLLYGKQGAELLPFMGDLADEHDRVTAALTEEEVALRKAQAAMADAFGDNMAKLQLNSEDLKRSVAEGMTPALFEASQALLDMTTGSGGLREKVMGLVRDGTLAEWARGAMTALSYLLDVGQGLFNLLPMLGTLIAGVAAGTSTLFSGIVTALDQLKSGNISAAWDSLKAGFSGVGEVATQTGSDIAGIWGQKLLGQTFRDRMNDLKGTAAEAGKTKTSMEGLAAAARRLEEQKKRDEAASKAAEAAQKKLREEYERAVKAGNDLVDALEKKGVELERELDLGRKLTPVEKELIDLEDKLTTGKIALTKEEEAHARAVIASNAALERNITWMNDTRKANDDARKAIADNAEKLGDQITALVESNSKLGLSKTALNDHELALIDDKKAAVLLKAELLDLVDPDAARALRDQAGQWEQIAGLKKAAFDKGAALESERAWLNTSRSIGEGMADALMGGADSAKSYIVNLFKNTLIRVPLQALMTGIVGGIGSMFSGAAAAGGAGGPMGMLGDIGGGLGGLANFGGTGIVAGLGSLGAGASYGLAGTLAGNTGMMMSAAGEMIGAGSTMAGIGTGLGAIAPYALAAYALYSLLNKKSTPHVGGYAMAGADGSISDITAAMGGRQVAESQGAVSALAGTLAALLNDTSGTFGGAGGYSVRSVFESDNNDKSWGLFHLLQNGMKAGGSFDALGTLDKDPTKGFAEYASMAAAGVRTALESLDLPQWASDALDALGASPSVENLATAVGQINAMQKALIGMGEAVADLGGPFDKVAGLSSDAKKQLADFTGGIEAFIQKTQSYISSYYTEGEQMAIQARDILRVLADAGINGSAATAKSDLRTLMDSLDPNSESGRRQMAALLNVAASYADVGKYIESNAMTLGELADMSPNVAALQDPTETTAAATKETSETVKDVAANTEATTEAVTKVVDAQENQTDVLAEGFKQMLAELRAMNTRLQQIEDHMAMSEARPA